ncbi:MAG: hypothetical protein ISS49_12915 [Anaerolineae bacterium]|nr:hypothetical protein [Anaerolineae bacterium]
MKTRTIAVVAGALVTLFSWAIAFIVLNGIYRGNFPWLLTGLVAFLCPIAGGHLAARLGPIDSMRPGALSGLGAGLVVLLVAIVVSRSAPNTTLAGAVLVVVGTIGGGVGAFLTPKSG